MMRTPPPTNASYLPSVSEGLEPPRSAAPPAWPALFPRKCCRTPSLERPVIGHEAPHAPLSSRIYILPRRSRRARALD